MSATSAQFYSRLLSLFCFISLFLFYRVFNVTGHGTVAPLTRPSAGFAETSALRPSPLLAPPPLPRPLLQGSVPVHLVSFFLSPFVFLRLAHLLTCISCGSFSGVSVAVNRKLLSKCTAHSSPTGASVSSL